MPTQQQIDQLNDKITRLIKLNDGLEVKLLILSRENDSLKKDINELHMMIERYKGLSSQLAKPAEVVTNESR